MRRRNDGDSSAEEKKDLLLVHESTASSDYIKVTYILKKDEVTYGALEALSFYLNTTSPAFNRFFRTKAEMSMTSSVRPVGGKYFLFSFLACFPLRKGDGEARSEIVRFLKFIKGGFSFNEKSHQLFLNYVSSVSERDEKDERRKMERYLGLNLVENNRLGLSPFKEGEDYNRLKLKQTYQAVLSSPHLCIFIGNGEATTVLKLLSGLKIGSFVFPLELSEMPLGKKRELYKKDASELEGRIFRFPLLQSERLFYLYLLFKEHLLIYKEKHSDFSSELYPYDGLLEVMSSDSVSSDFKKEASLISEEEFQDLKKHFFLSHDPETIQAEEIAEEYEFLKLNGLKEDLGNMKETIDGFTRDNYLEFLTSLQEAVHLHFGKENIFNDRV